MQKSISVFLMVALMTISVPTFLRSVHRRFAGVKPGVYLEERSVEFYYPREVRVIVEQMARRVQRPPQNASIDKDTGHIIPHVNGIFVDVDQTVNDILTAPRGAKLTLRTVAIVPEWRTEHFVELDDRLGDFSTPLMGSPGRINNIRLSLAALNNTVVFPGEVFSFNGVVGERTWEKGYRNAPIILGETVVPGVGGGVCQTSTTLYNAVRRAGLEIVERRIHSLAPSYIQHGKDAAVAWPHTDFKFRNNRSTPVIVKGAIDGWRARVWILGVADQEG